MLRKPHKRLAQNHDKFWAKRLLNLLVFMILSLSTLEQGLRVFVCQSVKRRERKKVWELAEAWER
jgi:hypothetical protein